MSEDQEYEHYIYDGHLEYYGRMFIRLTKSQREYIINNLFHSADDVSVFDMLEGKYRDIYCGFVINTVKYGIKL